MKTLAHYSQTTLIVISVSICLLIGGCDIGINPLIFDGTPVEATFEVNSLVSTFPPIVYSVDLQEVLSDIDDEVDSIKVYNITLHVENSGGNNPSVTGDITVNGNTLVSLSNTPVSAFAAERTIFDPGLQAQGFNYSPTIVPTINGYLKQDPKPTVNVVASGSANQSPLHFTIHVKVYTQVFLKP
jgi:hypothetical protein